MVLAVGLLLSAVSVLVLWLDHFSRLVDWMFRD